MGARPYVLLDRALRNFLGEFETLAEAEAALLRFVGADANAAGDLGLWHEERERLPVDPEKLGPAAGA
ncbi:MAG: hypothetical protein IT201_11805 [Thermoleophilia bacterium]|nr:hypothetical protein [Thermoleophilia bacterium]